MAKVFSSIVLTVQKYLRLHPSRFYSSEIKGSLNKAPICKGRKMSEQKEVCKPKEMSCSSKLGDCPKVHEPKCSEPIAFVSKYLSCCCDKHLTKLPCQKSPRKKRKQVEEAPFKSMWDVGYLIDRCPKFLERLDEKHYASSDKEKRRYTQTWKKCGHVVRMKKVCCFEDVCSLSPPFEKRCQPACADTASEKDSEKLKVDYNVLRKCLVTIPNPNAKRPTKCRKIIMPCCRPVAKSLSCNRVRGAAKCLKNCCPYPSFAECDHGKLRKRKPAECLCRLFVNQCDVNAYNTRRKKYGLPPPLPAWPTTEKPK